jgi:hypothetical protein
LQDQIGETKNGESDTARETRISKAHTELLKSESAAIAAAQNVASVKEKIADEEKKAEEDLAASKARLAQAELNDSSRVGKLKEAHQRALIELAREENLAKGKTGRDAVEAQAKVVDAQTKVKESENAITNHAKEMAKKEKEIRATFSERNKEIQGGRGAGESPWSAGGGNLQSIGGYFASAGAIGAAEKSRGLKTQEEIRKNTAEMNKALQKLADDNGA